MMVNGVRASFRERTRDEVLAAVRAGGGSTRVELAGARRSAQPAIARAVQVRPAALGSDSELFGASRRRGPPDHPLHIDPLKYWNISRVER
jgi:hypothetical protein